jgi:carbonic anhydrase
MDKVLEGIRRFREEVFPARRRDFEALAEGQNPEVLLVTCSDSRIDPSLFTQTDPGYVFVLRNAGNLVPAYAAGLGSEAATVEFAIEGLGIRHIAVCGHSHCGAMAALEDPAATAKLPALRRWLEHARPALERASSFEAIDDPSLRLVAANVAVQLDHLRTHPSVAEAEARGALTLHGWIYRFERGEVVVVDPAVGLRPLDG